MNEIDNVPIKKSDNYDYFVKDSARNIDNIKDIWDVARKLSENYHSFGTKRKDMNI